MSFSPGSLPQTLLGETYFCQFSSLEQSNPFATPYINGLCNVGKLLNQMAKVKLG